MKNLFPDDEHSRQVGNSFARLYNIIRSLRGPNGCPWDKEQTPLSLRKSLLEESYEAVEAITNHDGEHIKEELGDVILVVLLIMYIEEQEKSSTVDSMLQGLENKLIRRHPHVFADALARNSQEVMEQWQQIKSTEKKGSPSPFSVPKHLPSMEQAYELQRQAAKRGFDWENHTDVIAKVREEIMEVEDALQTEENFDQQEHLEEEIGDLLFVIINLSRKLKIHPAHALTRTNSKFCRRFSYIEEQMEKTGLEMNESNLAKMEEFWNKSKTATLNKPRTAD